MPIEKNAKNNYKINNKKISVLLEDINIDYDYSNLKDIDNIFYAFFNEDFLGHSSKIYVFRNNTNSIIELDDIPFEKGKYYYFNDIDNSFNIPPMEEGN